LEYLADRSAAVVCVDRNIVEINGPRGMAVEGLVGSVATPQTLDQHGGCWDLPVSLLTLLR